MALVALGGNLGDVRQSMLSARCMLDAHPQCRVLASSKLYRTPPIGPAGQPDYLNAALQVATSLSAAELLSLLHEVEHQHGRERLEHWGARTLDLDLLAYADLVSADEALKLPHPHMAARQFVLVPLADIAPDWSHPLTGRTTMEMLQDLLRQGEAPLAEGVAW